MAYLPWKTVKEYDEITFKEEGVARIVFVVLSRNAFTPKTVDELWEAPITCHESWTLGWSHHWRRAFVQGRRLGVLQRWDQNVQIQDTRARMVSTDSTSSTSSGTGFMNKVVIAVAPGWASRTACTWCVT